MTGIRLGQQDIGRNWKQFKKQGKSGVGPHAFILAKS